MLAFDGSERCAEAETYYHDILEAENCPPVPASVTDHIQSCGRCQERLARLKEMLSDTADAAAPDPSWRNGRLVAELQAHFECLKQPITCTCARPFLPNLLIGSIKIRIPTPITVHLDHCPACSDDLESLRQLDLGAWQLAMLNRLYAEGPTSDSWDCLRVQASLQRDVSSGAEPIPCADISWSDIFDSLVFGVEIAGESGSTDQQERYREHVWSCAPCLERTRELYGALHTIAQRPDSGVVTVCSTTERVAAGAAGPETPYDGYPLDVQVLSRPTVRRSDRTPIASDRRVSCIRLRPFLKVAALAAAMIPLAILFFANRPISASGPTARDINRQLARAMNVHMAQYGVDHNGAISETPTQEYWACRAQGILISKTADTRVLYDLKKRSRSILEGPLAIETDVRLDRNAYDRARRLMEGLLAPSLENGPWDAELTQIENVREAGAGIEVYERAWKSSRYGGPDQPRKWRFHVYSETKRPRKAEFFQWDPLEQTFFLATTRQFDYPDEDDILRRRDALLSGDSSR